jgi:dynein heavy chain
MSDNQPELEKTLVIVAEKNVFIAAETSKAEEVKAVVSVDKQKAEIEAADVKAVKDDADNDLNKALPELDKAVQKVK